MKLLLAIVLVGAVAAMQLPKNTNHQKLRNAEAMIKELMHTAQKKRNAFTDTLPSSVDDAAAQYAEDEYMQYLAHMFGNGKRAKSAHTNKKADKRDAFTDTLPSSVDDAAAQYAEDEYMEYLAHMFGGGKKRASHVSKSKSKKQSGAPNIFFFLIDDLGWNDVSWHNDVVQTPFIDSLLSQSTVLENAYAQPVCSPSRGALMTGKYPFHTGMQHDVIQWTSPECAPLSETFLAQKLADAGYETKMLGKWHLGFCNDACTPPNRGFNEFFGFYQGYIDHYHHYTGETGKEGYDFRDGADAYTVENGTYATDMLTARSIDMIKQHDQSKPMFMYFAHAAVHTPLQAPQRFLDMYPDSVDDAHNRKTFLAMASAMDDSIQQTVQAIKDAGMYENSVIIFQSDNGGEFYAGSNYPLRGSKTSIYEGGTRVPAFFHSPLSSSPPAFVDDLFHITDWHPTILSLAGAPIDGGLDGIDQTPLLMDGGAGERNEVVYNIDQVFPQLFGAGAIRVGNFKLIRGYPGLFDGWESNNTLDMTHTVGLAGKRSMDVDKRGNYNFDFGAILGYIKQVEDSVQLFDLSVDPNEEQNIAASQPDKVAELSARLDVLVAEAKMPNLAIQVPEPAGEASNFGGIWTPGWCDASTLD